MISPPSFPKSAAVQAPRAKDVLQQNIFAYGWIFFHAISRLFCKSAKIPGFQGLEFWQTKFHAFQGFPGPVRTLISVVIFGTESVKTLQTRIAHLKISLQDGLSMNITANVVPKITGQIHRAPLNIDKANSWWKELPLADTFPLETETSTVHLLIGNDYYLNSILPDKIAVLKGLYLLRSKTGWILRTTDTETEDLVYPSMFVHSYVNQHEPVKFIDGRYSVTWPWKEDNIILPDNYTLVSKSFVSLVGRLKKNPDLLVKYDDVIKDQINKGVIEEIKPGTLGTCKHYIPHHPFISENNNQNTNRL